MRKRAIGRAVAAACLTVLVSWVASPAQVVPPDDERIYESLEDLRDELDALSQDLADEYLDILEQLQEIVEDYSDYLSDLDPETRRAHPISFEPFASGLESGKYAESYEPLLEDFGRFVADLKALENAHLADPAMAESQCCRIVRNLHREMNILVDLTEEYVEHSRMQKDGDRKLQAYLKANIKRFVDVEKLAEEVLKSTLKAMEKARRVEETDADLEDWPDTDLEDWPSPPPEPPVIVIPNITADRGRWTIKPGGKAGLIREYSDSIRVTDSDRRIIVANPHGDVRILGYDGNLVIARLEIEVQARSRSDEKDFVSRARLDVSSTGGDYMVTATLPGISDPTTRILTSVLSVDVPGTNPVVCTNAYGQVQISDLQGGLSVTGSSSELQVELVRGGVTAENSMGSILLQDVTGPIVAQNAYGPVEISDCDGDMQIQNAYEAVTLRNCRGQVQLKNSGNVRVSDHTGRVSIENTLGPVEVTDVDGEVSVTNAYMPIIVRRVSESAVLTNTHSTIDVLDVGGSLTTTCSFGQFRGAGLTGPLYLVAVNSLATIILDGPLRGASTIDASYGKINLAVADRSDVYLRATSVDGDIQTLLPLRITGEGAKQSVEHRFGKGRDSLTVSANGAAIVISSSD